MPTDPSKTSIGPIDENPLLSAASSGLGSLRDVLNYINPRSIASGPYAVQLPSSVDPQPFSLGDLLLGKSPEEVKEWSQGFSPFYDQSYGFNPSIRPERREGVVSVAALPVAETAGLASLIGKGARSGVQKIARKTIEDATTDASRREFLKKSGATAATAATAGVLGRDFLTTADKTAVKTASKAAPKVVSQLIKTPHAYHLEKIYARGRAAQDVLDGLPKNLTEADLPKYLSKDEITNVNARLLEDLENPDLSEGSSELLDGYLENDPKFVQKYRDHVSGYYIKNKVVNDAKDLAEKEFIKTHGYLPTDSDMRKAIKEDSLSGDKTYSKAKQIVQSAREQGWLPKLRSSESWKSYVKGSGDVGDTIQSKLLREGGEYVDPFSGNVARLDPRVYEIRGRRVYDRSGNEVMYWNDSDIPSDGLIWKKDPNPDYHQSIDEIDEKEYIDRFTPHEKNAFARIKSADSKVKKANGGMIEKTTHDRKLI